MTEKFREALLSFGIIDGDSLIKDFDYITSNRFSPDECWRCMGAGAFKECYDVGRDNIIVKFAATDNHTDKEMEILSAAQEAGLSDIFLRTAFIPLDQCLPVTQIDNDEYGYYTYFTDSRGYTRRTWVDRGVEGYGLEYAIVQQRISMIVYHDKDNKHIPFGAKDQYNAEPILDRDGEAIPYEWIEECSITSQTWLSRVAKLYGRDFFKRMLNFFDDHGLHDLHYCNIGYTAEGAPIILDWLSA